MATIKVIENEGERSKKIKEEESLAMERIWRNEKEDGRRIIFGKKKKWKNTKSNEGTWEGKVKQER